MNLIRWNSEKNVCLKQERGVSFETVRLAIAQGLLLDVIEHPNQETYSHQRIFVVRVSEYAYLIPFVEDEETIFLKTIIPSRKMTDKYLRGKR
jgi:uncharacterized DUF497 family protein